jgi:hypothetical protein
VVDPTVDAGPEGGVPLAFLREALRVVKRTGAVVMLLLEEDVGRARTECERGGFRLACLGSRRLFFETLVVCEAKASGIWEGPRLD